MTSTDTEPGTLWKTAAGGRAHLRRCSHLVDKDMVEAADEPVCDLSQAELEGRGREYFADLKAALPAMGVSGSDWTQVHELLSDVDHDELWLPYSRSYIALGKNGQAVAWVGKNYVDIAGRGRTELPGYAATPGGGGPTGDPKYGPTCPTCFTVMALSGKHDCW